MKIFLFGANGMLGSYVKSYLSMQYDVLTITRNDYDLANLSIDTLADFFCIIKLIKVIW